MASIVRRVAWWHFVGICCSILRRVEIEGVGGARGDTILAFLAERPLCSAQSCRSTVGEASRCVSRTPAERHGARRIEQLASPTWSVGACSCPRWSMHGGRCPTRACLPVAWPWAGTGGRSAVPCGAAVAALPASFPPFRGRAGWRRGLRHAGVVATCGSMARSTLLMWTIDCHHHQEHREGIVQHRDALHACHMCMLARWRSSAMASRSSPAARRGLQSARFAHRNLAELGSQRNIFMMSSAL